MGANDKKRYYLQDVDNFQKSNVLIQSKYKTSLLGQKLISIGLFNIQKGSYSLSPSGGNIVCVISAPELKRKLGRTGNSLYRDLEKTAEALVGFRLGYKDPSNKTFRYINLFTESFFKDGTLKMVFNGDLRPVLIDFKDNYTIVNLPLLLHWKRIYTFRIFELLYGRAYLFENNGYNCSAEFELAEFKFLIGFYDIENKHVVKLVKDTQNPDYEKAEEALVKAAETDNSLSNVKLSWSEFKRVVLTPAIKEVNDTSECDMHIDDIETIKKGHGKVYKLIFKYRVQVESTDNPEDEFAAGSEVMDKELTEDDMFNVEAEVKSELSEFNLSIRDVRAICNAANYSSSDIKSAVNMLKDNKGEVQNVTGWLVSCVKDKYKKVTYKGKKTSAEQYNSYQQRNYSAEDFEAMERHFLNTTPEKDTGTSE